MTIEKPRSAILELMDVLGKLGDPPASNEKLPSFVEMVRRSVGWTPLET